MPVHGRSVEGGRYTTVVIADASRMDCQLLTHAIQRHSHIRVIGCATSCAEVISAVRENQPDVAVVSTRLQDGAFAGLLVLQELRSLQPQSRVIMMLDEDKAELVVEAFRHGARGIFCRTGLSAQLRKCLQTVHDGQIWANNIQLEHIVGALMQVPAPKFSKAEMTALLTKREEEVARLVAAGLSNREVSEKLGLSRHTIKNYLSRVFEELGISNRTELLLYILSQTKPSEAENNQIPAEAYKVSA
jgi:two-component system, NarL family, nitrate/nitrite response regulator NarL